MRARQLFARVGRAQSTKAGVLGFRMKSFGGADVEAGSVEASVGICEFANQALGFQGILKQRFSDFIVREVNKEGKVCRLSDMNGSEVEASVFAAQNALQAQEKAESRETPNIDALVTELESISGVNISRVDLDSLASFLRQCADESDDCPSNFTSALECNDKAVRTSLHQLFRRHASKAVDTDTVKNGTSSFIRVIAKHKMAGKGGQRRSTAAMGWPAGAPDFLQFTLCKENVDTMSAVSFLNKLLHTRAAGGGGGGVEYAGTKDKRAITAQTCTIYRRKPSELTRVNKMFSPYLLRVGDFCYVSKPASLGDLAGNRFSITLRALNHSQERVAAACETLGQSGFINYFGLQRFGQGSGAGRSHDIGRALFRGEWRAACDMMFQARVGERPEIARTKELYAAGKFADAAKVAPPQMHSERLVLEGLAMKPADFSGAFARVPKLTRLICVHAYQSFLWNQAASRRMKQYGLKCIEGDLVAVSAASNLEPARDNWDGNEAVEQLEGFENEEVPSDTLEELPNGSEHVLAAEGNAFQSAKHHGTVHVLTADDLASGRFSIKDVVLPIVGADSILPGNEIGSFYTELLARDGLTLGSFSTCVPVYRMSGAYRRLLQLPLDFSWRVMHYADPNAELAVTELTNARRRGDAGGAPEVAGAKGAGVVLDAAGTEASGPLQAVQLEFTLPPGTYATMLLRELTKESTETQFQAQLTAQEGRRVAAEVAEREDRDCQVDKTNGNTSKKQRVDEKS